MEYLSSDVVTEILLRLPAESLLRFRSVCRCWCNMIDSSTFRKSHLQNQPDDDTLLLKFNKTNLLDPSDPFVLKRLRLNRASWQKSKKCKWELSSRVLNPTTEKKTRKRTSFPCFQKFLDGNFSSKLFVAGLFNGLICIYYKIKNIDSTTAISIGVYNPCLDEIKILPLSPITSSQAYVKHGFDPSLGFCFDRDKNYKIVHFANLMPRSMCLQVYSGTTNTWRGLDVNLTFWDVRRIKSKSTGSKAYWQIETGWGRIFPYKILCFDVQNEVFEMIPYPECEDNRELDLTSIEVFVKDDDSFSLFTLTCDRQRLEVWKMQGHERCWTHVTDIDVGRFWHGIKLPWPQALWKRDGVVLMEYKLTGRSLIFYDCSSKQVIKSFVMPNPRTKNKALRHITIRKRFHEMPKSYAEVLELKCSLISPTNPNLGI